MKLVIWGQELGAWVTAGCLAQAGNDVYLVHDDPDVNPLDIMGTNTRNEPRLKDLIGAEHATGRFQLMSAGEASLFSHHVLCMNPSQLGDAKQIVTRLAKYTSEKLLIINQTLFGVGATDELQSLLSLANQQVVAFLPENIVQGEAIENALHPKSLTLGCDDPWANMMIESLLRPFSRHLDQMLVMSTREAEFAKMATTGMLALRIGYINELANLAEQLSVNIDVVRQSMGADPRIGHHYLAPGCGFGGNSFAQSIQGLSELLAEKRNSQLLDTVLRENEKQKEQCFRKLWRHYEADLHDKQVAIWGASFKPGTSALDGAPSLSVIEALIAQGVTIRIHDPEALENVERLYGGHPQVLTFKDKYEALENTDALLVLTEWPEYWSPDYEALLEQMRQPVVVDGRNVFSRPLLESLGITYYGIGR
jgi:UDPglucose 6-dehydrogenase